MSKLRLYMESLIGDFMEEKNSNNKNSLALVGMICSICGLLTCGISSIVGLILFIIGLNKSKTLNENGKGQSIVGIVVGSFIIVIVMTVMCVALSEETSNHKEDNVVNDNQIQETEKTTYLEGTNSDDFAEILKSVTEIENLDGIVNKNSITYTSENDKYNVTIVANKDTKEICYVKIISLTSEDATNVFMALHRMNYTTENDGDYTNWLVDNIGKEATTKIGDANFILSLSTSNHPILEMNTDGYVNK